MIFKIFSILSTVIAIALPTVMLIAMFIKEAGSGIFLGLALLCALLVLIAGNFLGAILQGIYNFSVAKSLFVRLKNFTIYRSENGHFLVFFKEKIERKTQTHRLEIELLDSNRCHLTHSTTEGMREWKEICSKDLTIDECKAEYNFSMQGNCSALFAFLALLTSEAKI